MSLLPTVLHEPSKDPQEYVWFFYGAPGTGKSTIATQFPKALHLVCGFIENPEHLRTYQVRVTAWRLLQDIEKELLKGKHDFKTVVFDTITEAFELCEQHILEEYGITSLQDKKVAYGVGYAALKDEFTRLMKSLRSKGLCIVFLAHVKKEQVPFMNDDGKKDTFAREIPNGGKQCWDVCSSMANFIGKTYREIQADGSPPDFFVSFASNQFYEAKAHSADFMEKKSLNHIKISKGKQAIGYEKIQELFKGE